MIRNFPKQNIIFDYLWRVCALGIGVKFRGNILMMDEKYFVPSEISFAAYEQPYSLVILMRKKKAKKICVKSEQSLFIFNHKVSAKSLLFINFLKGLINNR